MRPQQILGKPLGRFKALTTTQPWALQSILSQNNCHTDRVREENYMQKEIKELWNSIFSRACTIQPVHKMTLFFSAYFWCANWVKFLIILLNQSCMQKEICIDLVTQWQKYKLYQNLQNSMHIKVFQSTLQLLCDVRKHFVPGETSIHYQNIKTNWSRISISTFL